MTHDANSFNVCGAMSFLLKLTLKPIGDQPPVGRCLVAKYMISENKHYENDRRLIGRVPRLAGD